MATTPESRLAFLLERCALVKNELADLNEERVELEINLRLVSQHALVHTAVRQHNYCHTRRSAVNSVLFLTNIALAGCRSLAADLPDLSTSEGVYQEFGHGVELTTDAVNASRTTLAAEPRTIDPSMPALEVVVCSSDSGCMARWPVRMYAVLHHALCRVKRFFRGVDVITPFLPDYLCPQYKSYQLLKQRVYCSAQVVESGLEILSLSAAIP